MTIPSFVAFMVFMFVFGVVLVLICAWFVSDFVFKRILKNIKYTSKRAKAQKS